MIDWLVDTTMGKIVFFSICAILVILFAVGSCEEHETCKQRGGVIVYSTPVANGVPVPQCVAAPPPLHSRNEWVAKCSEQAPLKVCEEQYISLEASR